MEPKFEAISALHNWDMNYDAGCGPMSIFLDLIGYSDEQGFGPLFNFNKSQLGYLELDYLADALKEYAQAGQSAHDHVTQLMEAN